MDSIHPLRAYRERQSPPLTQEQLAEQLGVSKVAVSRWETGKRQPEHTLVPAISAKTGIKPGALRPDLAGLFAPSVGKRVRRRRAAA